MVREGLLEKMTFEKRPMQAAQFQKNKGPNQKTTTYFINAEGYAIAQATSAIDADTLQRRIDMITQES